MDAPAAYRPGYRVVAIPEVVFARLAISCSAYLSCVFISL
jgi:hypothetical protein